MLSIPSSEIWLLQFSNDFSRPCEPWRWVGHTTIARYTDGGASSQEVATPPEGLGEMSEKSRPIYIHPRKLTWNPKMMIWKMCFSFSNGWFSGSMLNFGGVITRWWFQILFIFTPRTWGNAGNDPFWLICFQMGWFNHQLDNYAYIRTSSSVMIRIMDCFDPSKGNLYSPTGVS